MKAHSSALAAKGGFLLVGVLLLLSLLTVLVVASVMIAQIERRASANGGSAQLAQQNALFALNTALGQLQREAGPDQRVTARADILSGTPAPTANNGATAYWTGVWKTYNPNGGINQQLDIGTTPLRTWSTTTQGPRWLVSLPSSALTMSPTNTLATPTATVATGSGNVTLSTVTVANVGSAGTSYPVNVPLVPMMTARTFNNTTNQVQTGQYAYWVSDEGIKAKANLIDTNVGINPASYLVDSQREFLAPAANAVYKILPSPFSSSSSATDIRANATNVARVSSPLSMQYAQVNGTTGSASGWTTSTINQNLADITTYSMGVLADVRKGGLKNDLTAAFENGLYTASPSYCNTLFPLASAVPAGTGSNDTQTVYRAFAGTAYGTTPNYGQTIATADAIGTGGVFPTDFSGISSSGDFYDGLPWASLYYFYNLYKGAIPLLRAKTNGTGVQATTTDAAPGSYPYAGTSLDWYTLKYPASSPVVLPLAPVVLACRMDLSIQPFLSSGNLWSATLTACPQVILWNPYSVPLNASNFYFNKATTVFTANSLWCWVGKSTWSGGSAGSVSAGCSAFAINNNGGGGRSAFQTMADSTPFQPGEIRVYALASNVSLTSFTPSTAGSSGTGSVLNFNTTSGSGLNTPTSLYAKSPSGDNGQSISFVIGDGVHNNQGAAVDPSTDLFHVAIGVASSGVATVPYSSSNAYIFGGATANDESAPTAQMWPDNNNRIGDGVGPFINLSPTPNWTTSPGDNTLATYTASGPYRLIAYETRMKGLQSSASSSSSSWTTGTKAAPLFMGNTSAFNLLNDNQYGSGSYEEIYGSAFNVFNGATDTALAENQSSVNSAEMGSVWGYYSAGDQANVGASGSSTNNVVLYDIPNQPMVSLGQFMHMPLSLFYAPATFSMLPGATMFVGGSLACPEVPLCETANVFTPTTGSIGQNQCLYLDNSFLANQALFDSYFFSTVPPSGGFSKFATTPPKGIYTSANLGGSSTFSSTYISQNKPLPNARMRYYYDNGNAPTTANLQSPYLAAANLLVDGAFNVNSTSVPAWIALLSSLNGNQLQLWNASSASVSSNAASASQTLIPRFWSGTSGSTGGPWDGTHPLTDTQIKTLAQEIVAQVKARGPFLSMGDFLNRRLAPTGTTTDSTTNLLYTKGALQEAIDTDTSGINTTALSYGVNLSSANTFTVPYSPPSSYNSVLASKSGYALPAVSTIVSNTAVGIPAYLMQQDIVQAFAPVMTVRSDTFVIRCYGEADNPSNGAVQGQAWGEAVVQRLPDYVDQTDSALTTAPSTTSSNVVPPITTAIGNATPIYDSKGVPLLNATNQAFGRRFKIISFHWLNSNDL